MAQKFADDIEKSLYDKNKPWSRTFDLLEQKCGMPRTYIFLIVVTACLLYLIFGCGGQLLCNIIGFVYPAYASLRSLSAPENRENSKWTIYWVIFGTFTVLECFSIFVWIIPFYYLIKCIFLLWCMMSGESSGTNFIHKNLIRPYFSKNL